MEKEAEAVFFDRLRERERPTPGPWRYTHAKRDDDSIDRFQIQWCGRVPKPNAFASFLGEVYREPDARLVCYAPKLLAWAREYAAELRADDSRKERLAAVSELLDLIDGIR